MAHRLNVCGMDRDEATTQILKWARDHSDEEGTKTLTDIPATRRTERPEPVPVYEGRPGAALRALLMELRGTVHSMPMGDNISSDFILGFRRALELACDIVETRLLPFDLEDLAEYLPRAPDDLPTRPDIQARPASES